MASTALPGARCGLARTFFERVLPQALTAQTASLGACVFELTGPGGGVWTVDLAEQRAVRGHRANTARVRLDAATLEHILRGTLDAAEAVLDGRMVLEGEDAGPVLEALAAALESAELTS